MDYNARRRRKRILRPLVEMPAWKAVDVIEGMQHRQIAALLRAMESCTQTNCWYGDYGFAQALLPFVRKLTPARPLDRLVGRGRIVDGAGIFQDRYFGKWPQCCPPRSEYNGEEYQYQAKNPDMIFDVEWNGHHWDCKADGYGYLHSKGEDGEYGNGSIFVMAFDGVELVTPNA